MGLQTDLVTTNGYYGQIVYAALTVRDTLGTLFDPAAEIAAKLYSVDQDDGDALSLVSESTAEQDASEPLPGWYFANFDTSLLSAPATYPAKYVIRMVIPHLTGEVIVNGQILLHDPNKVESPF